MSPFVRALAPPAAALLIRAAWAGSRVRWIRPELMDRAAASGRPHVMAFWHSRLMLMQYAHRGRKLAAMISRHGDGELIARTMARFGHAAVRGSSTRGGSRALREAVRWIEGGGDLAITPDGPRGPARAVKPGAVTLARLAGAPIFPVSLAMGRSVALRSWDGFEVPLPFGKVAIAYGELLPCPREAGDPEVEDLCRELARRLDALTDECRAAVGLPPWPVAATGGLAADEPDDEPHGVAEATA